MAFGIALLLLIAAPISIAQDSASSDADTVAALIALGLMLAAYFLPWILAKFRGHRSSLAIFWTVLLFGWTGVVWLFAFIWACTGNTENNYRRELVVAKESGESHEKVVRCMRDEDLKQEMKRSENKNYNPWLELGVVESNTETSESIEHMKLSEELSQEAKKSENMAAVFAFIVLAICGGLGYLWATDPSFGELEWWAAGIVAVIPSLPFLLAFKYFEAKQQALEQSARESRDAEYEFELEQLEEEIAAQKRQRLREEELEHERRLRAIREGRE